MNNCMRDITDTWQSTELVIEGKSLSVGLASNLQDRQQAYELIYQLYLDLDLIDAHPSQLWLSIFDGFQDTVTIIFKDNEEVVATGTVVLDSHLGLPLDDYFKEETDKIRVHGPKLAEFTSLGIKKSFRNTQLAYTLIHVLLLFMNKVANCSDFIFTAHKKHRTFYQRNLGCSQMGSPRPSKVKNSSTVAMHANVKQMAEKMNAMKNLTNLSLCTEPFFMAAPTEMEEEKLLEHFKTAKNPMAKEEQYYFFVEKTDILARATPQQQDYLNKENKKQFVYF